MERNNSGLRGLLSRASTLVLVCTKENRTPGDRGQPPNLRTWLAELRLATTCESQGYVPSSMGAGQQNPSQTKMEGQRNQTKILASSRGRCQLPQEPAKTNTQGFPSSSKSHMHPAPGSRAHLKVCKLDPPPAQMMLSRLPSPVPRGGLLQEGTLSEILV